MKNINYNELIKFNGESLSRADLAVLMIKIIDLHLITMPIAFALSHKLGLFSDNLYKLFSNYEPIREDIPEFLEGYLKDIQEVFSNAKKKS